MIVRNKTFRLTQQQLESLTEKPHLSRTRLTVSKRTTQFDATCDIQLWYEYENLKKRYRHTVVENNVINSRILTEKKEPDFGGYHRRGKQKDARET